MVAGRPDEREAAVLDRLDRGARGEPGDPVGRRRAERVTVEPCAAPALRDGSDEFDVVVRVAGKQFLDGRRASLDEVREGSVERRQALRAFRMLAGRVQVGEVGVRDDVDAPS
jgi:hypothetical protein